ncbi:protein ALP1-like [Cryptotermes secundus]|nr:protein ALP1-like [Cryptotermes secundus]
MYYNYKKYFSIVLQGVVAADYRFICIDVGAYGKQSDSGIFGYSNLAKQLERGALKVNCETELPGTELPVPYVLVGDEEYPLKTFLMRPYPQRRLGSEEEIFNKRLAHARQVVECAFGIVSNKWRILLKALEVTPERAEQIVKCICLLHNIIIDKEGMTDLRPTTVEPSNPHLNRFATRGENRSTARACDVRDTFKMYFVNNP